MSLVPGQTLFPPSGPPPMPAVRLGWLGEAWRLFAARAWLWLGVTLFLLALSAGGVVAAALLLASRDSSPSTGTGPSFSWHVLFGGDLLIGAFYPLFVLLFSGGIYRIALGQTRGEAVGFGDLFHFRAAAVRTIGFGLAAGGLIALGLAVCVVPGLILAGLLLPAPLFLADGDGAFPAIGRSVRAMSGGLSAACVLVATAGVLLAAGLVPCGLGLLVTHPLCWLLSAVAWRETTHNPAPQAQAATVPAGLVWPPPPTAPPPG